MGCRDVVEEGRDLPWNLHMPHCPGKAGAIWGALGTTWQQELPENTHFGVLLLLGLTRQREEFYEEFLLFTPCICTKAWLNLPFLRQHH